VNLWSEELNRCRSNASWKARLDALGPAPRAELLHVLMPDFDRVDGIGSYWGCRKSYVMPLALAFGAVIR
jgi:hypothetical protein